MSVTTEVTDGHREEASAGSRGRRRFPMWLWWLLGIIVLTVGLSLLAAQAGRNASREPWHPNNAMPEGSRAVDEVLAAQGVRSRTVTTRAEMRRLDPGPDTTVVVDARGFDVDALQDISPDLQRAGRVILAEPGHPQLIALDLPVQTNGNTSGVPRAECVTDLLPDPAPTWAVTGATTYRPEGNWVGCYGPTGQAGLVTGTWGGAEMVVLGDFDFATNGEVLHGDNAQMALRLLGAHENLVWYFPDATDVPASDDPGDTDQPSVMPPWFGPVLGLSFGVVAVFMVAGGRRFGPLSREPLPVVVSAAESTIARARLLRRHGTIGHSAERLRQATCRRLCRRIGLPSGASPERLAERLRITHPQAVDLLTGPLPTTERTALEWVEQLQQLEREVSLR